MPGFFLLNNRVREFAVLASSSIGRATDSSSVGSGFESRGCTSRGPRDFGSSPSSDGLAVLVRLEVVWGWWGPGASQVAPR